MPRGITCRYYRIYRLPDGWRRSISSRTSRSATSRMVGRACSVRRASTRAETSSIVSSVIGAGLDPLDVELELDGAADGAKPTFCSAESSAAKASTSDTGNCAPDDPDGAGAAGAACAGGGAVVI